VGCAAVTIYKELLLDKRKGKEEVKTRHREEKPFLGTEEMSS